ncbi:MAG TPA: MmcQ/YjbR family DNA-binding protein [Micromonosporaceae bacterium]
MATLNEAARIALALPEVIEVVRHDQRAWSVQGKVFAWERRFSRADIKRYGDQIPPEGPIIATVVADLAEKEAVVAEGREGIFTIPHFNGYAAILVQLRVVSRPTLREAITDGWLAAAPPALADQYVQRRRRPRSS